MKRLLFIIVLLTANTALAATDVVPLRFYEGIGNDPPSQVTAYVTYVTDTIPSDTVALTRIAAGHPAGGLWADSVTLTLGEWYTIEYVAVWTSSNDTSRTASTMMIENPADYKSSGGSGGQLDSILVMDTSGADAPIQGAQVTIYSDGFTGNGVLLTPTNAAGWTTYNLSASTAYDFVVTATAFAFAAHYDITTDATATDSILIQGYNVVVGAPTSVSCATITGYERNGPDTVRGGTVVATLVASVPGHVKDTIVYDTLSHVNYAIGQQISTDIASDGSWTLYVPVNTYFPKIRTAWAITCTGPDGGTRWSFTGIHLTSTAATCMAALTGAGSCP